MPSKDILPFASSVNDSPSDRAKSRTVPYNNNDRKATTPEKFERGETSCGKNVDESLEKVRNMKLEIPESNFDKFMTDKNLLSVDSKCSNEKKLSVESDLSAIYENTPMVPLVTLRVLTDLLMKLTFVFNGRQFIQRATTIQENPLHQVTFLMVMRKNMPFYKN